MENVVGRFYFKLSSNGNLLGEYSNDKSQDCDVEAAKRLSGDPVENENPFIGEYKSTWTEGDRVVFSDLIIEQKKDSDTLFSIKWSDSKRTIFTGEAMIVDGILIGNYQSIKSS